MDQSKNPVVGVYICHCGGNISDVVEVEAVASEIAKLPQVAVSQHIEFMCSDPGQNAIIEDIREKGLNRIVVASCSPKLHEITFRRAVERAGLNPYLYQHANIREQVSWCTHHDHAGATQKAIRLIKAAVAKASKLEPLEPIRLDVFPRAVVIGGGISGLKTSLDLSRYGIKVTLLEKTPFLGGRTAQLRQLYPDGEQASDIVNNLVNAVLGDPGIEVHTYAEVTSIEGHIGNFQLRIHQQPRGVVKELKSTSEVMAACPVTVPSEFEYGLTERKAIYYPAPNSQPALPAIDWQACNRCGECINVDDGQGINLSAKPKEYEIEAGAIVIATGFDHYEPKLGEFGYGEFSEVVTLPQLIRLMSPNGPTEGRLEWNGRTPQNIAFIHCVGSRQLESNSDVDDSSELNKYCSRVCCTATLWTADEIHKVHPEINIFDFYRDIRTYGRGHEKLYQAASDNGALFFRYRPEEPPVIQKASGGDGLEIRVKDDLTGGQEIHVPVDLVVLSVGMVPHKIEKIKEMLKLPVGFDRFLLEVHPKLRPVEAAVSGVFLVGTSQGPKDTIESCETASAVAVKVAGMLSRGFVELDPYVAVVDQEKCTGMGHCVKVCEYPGAIEIEETDGAGKKVKIDPALCRGCGACAAACPNKAIKVNGWTLDQYEAMVDAILAEGCPIGSS